MKDIKWNCNKMRSQILELNERFDALDLEEIEEAEDIEIALFIIGNLLNNTPSFFKNEESFKKQLEKDKMIIEKQEDFMSPISAFAKQSELSNYKVANLSKMNIKKSVLLSFLHDFYHSLDRELAKLFDRIYKERKDNLQILNSPDLRIKSYMYYIKPIDYAYINLGLTNTIADYTNLVHEYGHTIADQMCFRPQYDKYPFIELLPMFLEELAYDDLMAYYEEAYEEANKSDLLTLKQMYDYSKGISIQYSFLCNYHNINKRSKFVQQMARFGNNTVSKTERILNRPLEEKIAYVIPYLTMIELYSIYQKDPEKALYLVKQIVMTEEQENYMKYLESLGINLNEHSKEFIRCKKKNNITQYM